jgi:hypothetical protein
MAQVLEDAYQAVHEVYVVIDNDNPKRHRVSAQVS